MKVRFIKGEKAGSIVEADNKRAAYWQRMGLVEEVFDSSPIKSIKYIKVKKAKKKSVGDN